MMRLKLGNKIIKEGSRPYIIAEAGINFDGKLSKCYKLIDEASKSGADAIKFQTHIAECEMIDTKVYLAHSKKETVYQLMKRCELSLEDHKKLLNYAKRKKITFISTPFSLEAAKLLNKINVPFFKIGSGECNNIPLIKEVLKFKKPVIISTGMNSIESISRTMNSIKKYKNKIALLHCLSIYPTRAKQANLDTIKFLKKKFNCIVGFSDHSTGTNLSKIAISNGANIIEKHFTVSSKWSGPDISISSEPNEILDIKNFANDFYNSKGVKKKILKEEMPVTKFAYASVVSTKNILKGEKFTKKNIWVKRPGTGYFRAVDLFKILGKRAKRNIKKDAQIKKKDI